MTAHGQISIVIPCYNQGALLRETLASVERIRNDRLLEVIIVNDGSTEAQTLEIFAGLDSSSYTVRHQPNAGLGAARNAGIRMARGEFILPLDSDNLIRPAYLAKGRDTLLHDAKAGVVYGDAEFFGEETGRRNVPGFDASRLVLGNYIDACALYRKCVWEAVGGYDEKMPWMGWEDWDFWLRVMLAGWEFHHLDEIAFDYRVTRSSMLRSETNLHQEELLDYIFNKPGNRALRWMRDVVREQNRLNSENERLRAIEYSKDYRLGQLLLHPLRTGHRFLKSKN